MSELMRLTNMCKQFPGVKALDNVSCSVYSGEALGLIGINGAGKSTLMNVIAGEIKADSGEILIEGQPVTITNQAESKAHHISLIHQEPTVFGTMTVAENIFITDLDNYKKHGLVNYKLINQKAKEYLGMLESDLSPTALVSEVGAGGRQMIEIARALAQDANIILFDEPTSSLSIKEKEKLFDIIERLKAQNKAVIYITHFIDEVKELCEKVVVMMDGHVTASERTENLSVDEMIRLMVNVDITSTYEKHPLENPKLLLKVENLSNADYKTKNINFEMHKGEVVGLWGLLGSGRSEIMKNVLGVIKQQTGTVTFYGDNGPEVMHGQSLMKYSGYVTENRHLDGLFKSMPIWKNITMPNLGKYSRILMDSSREKSDSKDMIRDLKIKATSENVQVSKLSGGNQQKVIMARWVLKKPDLFFLDEPTRGVDIGAKVAIHELILDLAKQGSSVLLISSEMEENINLCDRILVIKNGTIVAEVPREKMNSQLLMRLSSDA